MKNVEIFERRSSNGWSVVAWPGDFEGRAVINVQWRDPSGKPVIPPFHLYIENAPEEFRMIAEFAEEMLRRPLEHRTE